MLSRLWALLSRRRLGRDGILPSESAASVADLSAVAAIAGFRQLVAGWPSGETKTANWLDISLQGFGEQQRGRRAAHLIKELVQNALDAVPVGSSINVWLTSPSRGVISVLCADGGVGTDVDNINVMFLTDKQDSAIKRGRMGRGFKEALSVSRFAAVLSREKAIVFDRGAEGNTITRHHLPSFHKGFHALLDIEHDEDILEIAAYLRSFIVDRDIDLRINGSSLEARVAAHVVSGNLLTEIFSEGFWQRRNRDCIVNLIPTAAGETPSIYEMGIPVAPVNWPERYHCDVQQRVPMNANRDAVAARYDVSLRALCFPTLLPEFTRERALASWVPEAALNVPYEERGVRKALWKSFVTTGYGEKVARSSPAKGRYDFDADAKEEHYLVLQTGTLSYELDCIVREVTPTSEEVFNERRKRRVEAARDRALSTDQVRKMVTSETLAGGPVGLEQAISYYSKDRVIDRMEFAHWLARSILEEKGLEFKHVQVRCAWLPKGIEAVWSENGVLTLSLAHDETWSKTIGASLVSLVVHEAAHEEAFHHGADFTREVEAIAGIAAMVFLKADRESLVKQYRTFEGNVSPNPKLSAEIT